MATILRQVALVSETGEVGFSDLARASAALQKQATRDFGPVWDVEATVDPFGQLEDVPLGYWPVILQDDIQQEGALGIHLCQVSLPNCQARQVQTTQVAPKQPQQIDKVARRIALLRWRSTAPAGSSCALRRTSRK